MTYFFCFFVFVFVSLSLFVVVRFCHSLSLFYTLTHSRNTFSILANLLRKWNKNSHTHNGWNEKQQQSTGYVVGWLSENCILKNCHYYWVVYVVLAFCLFVFLFVLFYVVSLTGVCCCVLFGLVCLVGRCVAFSQGIIKSIKRAHRARARERKKESTMSHVLVSVLILM